MPPLVIYYPDQIQKNDEVPSLLFEIKNAYLWFLFYYPSMKLPSHSLSRSTPAMNSRTSTRWRLFYFIFLKLHILKYLKTNIHLRKGVVSHPRNVSIDSDICRIIKSIEILLCALLYPDLIYPVSTCAFDIHHNLSFLRFSAIRNP